MTCWLVKSEPNTYAFATLKKDKQTVWDGIRNYQARNNLRAMHAGDVCLFYHSGEEKAVVGLARVVREAYPEPGPESETWSVVDLEFLEAFPRAVTLKAIKAHPVLVAMALVKNSRLSVLPVTHEEFQILCSLGGSTLSL
jgi:predicted RNA-binding protein with PUA-like domain